MAEVWLATDLILDRKVAVKWLKPSLASDPIVAERFRREAIAAASLNHPNIVAVHDVFESEGRQAVVMQFIDGKSLREVLNNKKRLSPQLTCHIGTCVAAALDNAHEAGFIHRDVKPGNIMITPGGRVLLTDFGIAKGLNGDDDLTSDNVMMGTAKYLSPEQVRGKRLDGRADLYSLGLVLYECLAGRVPFLGESDADTALARLQRDPTDLTRLRATLPTSLVITIHQLLARNPDHRPATGAELSTKLKEAAEEGPPVIDDTPLERSPVAPYPTGRLRRAPSDVPGQVSDRRRIARTGQSPPTSHVTAPHGSPTTNGVNGEVGAVVSTAADPRPVEPRSDPTPSHGAPRRGRPAKGLSNRAGPSTIVVGALIAVAVVVALILWATLSFGGGESTSTTTVLPSDAPEAAAAIDDVGGVGGDDPTGDAPAADPEQATDADGARIVGVIAYDPEGDGEENDAEAVAALADGDPETAWRTVCYSSQFMGAKAGVGLVVSFDAPTQQAITVDVMSGPYQLQFFGTDAEKIPDSLAGWGPELGIKAFGPDPATIVSAEPATPARHVLVLLNELGNDSACSGANPFRGGLGEIALSS
jgi:serine/threonine-protein kinase